jgi:hypothetical protein
MRTRPTPNMRACIGTAMSLIHIYVYVCVVPECVRVLCLAYIGVWRVICYVWFERAACRESGMPCRQSITVSASVSVFMNIPVTFKKKKSFVLMEALI